ncbi:response regulator transcription factor [Aerococcus sp. UMB7834]|uniref:response regulator transcription factor n=1 Tax=Aerococcus sp. UMB7834 TaxID=3046342 RepID=UPI00254F604A|nr:response regulator transcription factor [Aerococcus sp. UMB7834]MDK6805433.1 response regulator transcription factor [Aerococcus sp. UMB7834]
MRILIIEDDHLIAQLLEDHLRKWQYDVTCVQDFTRILEHVDTFDPHLILLDVNLPIYNGYYWCQEIRRQSQLPIIFISSRTEAMDMVMAMQMGGDDFISKPLELSVLVAKIQALLRRSYDFSVPANELTYHDVKLHLDTSQLTYGNQDIDLTKTELLILQTLFKAQGALVSREALMDACWLDEAYIDDNTLAVNISRLRKKLARINLREFILTKKGLGYALFLDSEEEGGAINE